MYKEKRSFIIDLINNMYLINSRVRLPAAICFYSWWNVKVISFNKEFKKARSGNTSLLDAKISQFVMKYKL
jgi:hypothetical protein